jgi:hypothetical protein
MHSKKLVVLFPQCLCETRSGNLAHAVGRLALRPGRPMLVEHVGGLFLEHDLSGRILSAGYGREYDIVHVGEENRDGPDTRNSIAGLSAGIIPDGARTEQPGNPLVRSGTARHFADCGAACAKKTSAPHPQAALFDDI